MAAGEYEGDGEDTLALLGELEKCEEEVTRVGDWW